MLKLTNICRSYGAQQVLSGLSLTVSPGQRVALMGPSGAGKTTLLRIALGLETPEQGTVENRFGKTAAVFQEPRLLPWRTALENVNLVLGDTPKTMEKARQVLAQMGLSEAAGKYPRELSGGMQQRVAIARAMAVEPELLVLDEPFKAMDEALRTSVIACVAKTGAAILLVTHELWEAEQLNCEIIRI